MNFLSLKSGKSVEGDEIEAYRSETKASTYTYLMAGTHGDEVEGVYVLNQLFDWLKSTDEFPCSFIVLPILNVDGYRAGTRVNSHGVDLNRNYPSEDWTAEAREAKYNPGPSALSEPENKFLDKLFQKFPPHLIISFHSWKPFINYNGDCKDVADFIAKYNEYDIMGDIEGHPTPGSLGNYGPEKYSSPVLTFECPLISDKYPLKKIWEENEEAFKQLLKSDLVAPKNS
ncbi:MAG: M14 family zinc carboxypeptidase [Halobacteriovoraceae bacterium]|nr:M14 family zinc carboxypeptidase [Halobacteriovoraceae bacterium]